MVEAATRAVTRHFAFAGAGGEQLAGIIDLPDGAVRGHALFAHCFTCTKSSLAAVRVARALARLGIGVLRFDFTGLGHSEGDFAQTGFSSNVGDLVAAAAAMEQAGMPARLLVGHSLGGAAVLAAAHSLPGIGAVVTIGAPYDVDHVRALFGDRIAEMEEKGEARVRLGENHFMIRRGFLDDLAAHDQVETLGALSRPLLIFHSPVDDVVGIENAASIYSAARHPKSFVSIDGADHMLTEARDAEFVAAMTAAWATRYFDDPAPDRTS